MLKFGEANPLAVFGLRKLDHCPPHFTTVEFDLKANNKKITDWVWANLSGRFFSGDHYYKDSAGLVALRSRVAFEIPGEASMFALILDQINQSDFDW